VLFSISISARMIFPVYHRQSWSSTQP